MKKIAMSILIAGVLSSINAKSIDVEVKLNENIQSKISPNKLLGTISVQEYGVTQEDVRNKLESIVIAVKNEDSGKLCTGGGYSSYPEDEWVNNKRVRKGYQGSVNFTCKVKEISDYDKIANAINYTSSKNNQNQKAARISQSDLNWVVDEDVSKKVRADMEIELVAAAESKAKVFSQKLSKICKVKSIDFTNSAPEYRPFVKAAPMMMTNMQDSVAPLSQDIEQSVSAVVTLSCFSVVEN